MTPFFLSCYLHLLPFSTPLQTNISIGVRGGERIAWFPPPHTSSSSSTVVQDKDSPVDRETGFVWGVWGEAYSHAEVALVTTLVCFHRLDIHEVTLSLHHLSLSLQTLYKTFYRGLYFG